MDLTRPRGGNLPPCIIEIHVPGVLYLRIERLPRWLAPLLVAVTSPAIAAWLLTR